MELTITILLVLLIVCVLYISALRKENQSLINENEAQFNVILDIEKDVRYYKDLAKTFEAGYDSLKNK